MKKLFSTLLVFIYLLVYSALILDAYKNPHKFENLALIGPEFLLLLALAINLLARINKMASLPSLFINLNRYLLFPFFSILTIVLTVWTYSSPPNYVYSKFPFNLEPILLMAILTGLISLINASSKFLRQNWQQITFLTPLFILLLGFLVALWKVTLENF